MNNLLPGSCLIWHQIKVLFSVVVAMNEHPNILYKFCFSWMNSYKWKQIFTSWINPCPFILETLLVLTQDSSPNYFQSMDMFKTSNFTFHTFCTRGWMQLGSDIAQQLWAWLYRCGFHIPAQSDHTSFFAKTVLSSYCAGHTARPMHWPVYVGSDDTKLIPLSLLLHHSSDFD